MKDQCPICLKDAKLVKHHWWEDKTHAVGHIRLICPRCNMILRTLNGEDNHVLPEWERQIKYVQEYISRTKTASCTCPKCGGTKLVKNGKCFDKDGNKVQRYLCMICKHNTQSPKTTDDKGDIK
jgi:uncharacterized C2H2 Zn-finger protein